MEMFAIIKIFFLSTLSFLIAMMITPFVAHFLYKYKLGKQIRDEKSAPIMAKLHAKKVGTPTMGGVIIWGTVLLVMMLFHYGAELTGLKFFSDFDFFSRGQTLLPLGVLIASALVGLVDDYWNVKKIGPHGGGLRFRYRLLVFLGIALVGALWFYFKLDWDLLRIPFVGDFNIGWWYIPFFMTVIIATSFSVNQTDGLDGLAGGVLLTSFGAYSAIAFAQGRIDLAVFCGVIVGALLAFLWFNINPARFFMGDTGAMSLGVTLGVVAMLTNTALLLPIIGFVFVLEGASTIIQLASKKFRGKKVFLSAPIHHHFELLGWPESKVVIRFWILGALCALVTLATLKIR